MNKKIFNIVSGAKSGALNVAVTVGDYLKQQGYCVETVLRKYNNTDLTDVTVIKDRCTVDYITTLANLIRDSRPDIILVHGYSTHLWTKMAAAYAKVPVKLIHVEHNTEKYTLFRRFLLRKLDRYTDKYICVSKGVAAHLIAQGIGKEKVEVIYNGIDIDKFTIKKEAHDNYTIGMAARFSRQKDQLSLIKAVEVLIKEQNLDINLILLGTGKTKKMCQDYVVNHALDGHILFKTGNLIDYLPQMDLFVLATHYEGFGLVVVEAMAAGVPVIASDVIGVNEIIAHGENGLLVKAGDFFDLAEKIKTMVNMHGTEKEKALMTAAHRVAEAKFAETVMLDCYLQHLFCLQKGEKHEL